MNQTFLGNNKQQNKKRARRMDLLPQIKYQMVFDEKVDGKVLLDLQTANATMLKEFKDMEIMEENDDNDRGSEEELDEDDESVAEDYL
jgi:hypothetical protein